MKEWKDLELQGLRWIQKGGWGRNYELQNENGEIIATLKRPRWWSDYAEVDAPGNRWTFEHKGLMRRVIVIRSMGTGDQPATYEKGRLKFPDGREFLWRQNNLWGTKWVWTTEDGQPVLGFQAGGFLRYRGEMSIPPDVEDMPSVALLVFLGWYMVSQYYEDASAMSAT